MVIQSAMVTKQRVNLIVINMHVEKLAVTIQLIYYLVIATNTIALMVLVPLLDIKRLAVHIVKDIILRHTKIKIVNLKYDLIAEKKPPSGGFSFC